jgi:ElaB/YqjD/DUF883 family membrane-anchored ribosome-binding protein
MMPRKTEQREKTSTSETAATSFEDGRRWAEELDQAIQGYIRQNPIRAVAYAAGAGVLLALLFRRK